ncbi:MAG: MoaD/ThiS family protein [Synechococcaceae cyanobacterium]|nr:MoaD/ThiS family protein [Synechococcaceae cyanobacterium]
MSVRVLLFAALRERAGWGERRLELGAAQASPTTIWRQLAGELGEGSVLPDGIRVAVNQCFADPGIPLADGDEVAFLPPISGG